ncbi:hypothetical protein BEN47_08245 [Hymenobacter lapidarius]|uniref:Uncharacterized protein n=1 Tax=Hymenobacter lapidarius TaxID=1908237 RepID=A0A1G1TE02_9BACT|nr:hypothetical protein [Hymenobacter lapidarius]OGX89104.1 hypothetical protein BEN47_08245 [Hymenobacter lapidarius]
MESNMLSILLLFFGTVLTRYFSYRKDVDVARINCRKDVAVALINAGAVPEAKSKRRIGARGSASKGFERGLEGGKSL